VTLPKINFRGSKNHKPLFKENKMIYSIDIFLVH
jgi:hypothetical protein